MKKEPLDGIGSSLSLHSSDRAALRALTLDERRRFVASLNDREAAALLYDWVLWARDKQLPPETDWRVWLILAGRGFGKTRTGAEWIRAGVEAGHISRISLVAETASDARDVMIEGESGILGVAPPWNRPRYEPSKRRLTWPNGAVATTFSAEDPEQLRGPQFDAAWADELGKWRYPEAWDNLMLSLRLGHAPRCVATTTPRPRAWLRKLMDTPGTHVTGGGTRENAANLAPAFLDQILAAYGGTQLARQEIDGELLMDPQGALWRRSELERSRRPSSAIPDLRRLVVAIDPAVGAGGAGAETGIIAAGMDEEGMCWVLEDLSLACSPDAWARRAVGCYGRRKADTIVAEANQGGALVEQVLRTVDPTANIRLVHASRGKIARAEPVAALYEQGRIIHAGNFPELEDQMCSYTGAPGETSPDRLDALVWAITDLALGNSAARTREFLI
ncbi:MAG: DNA-packaging protein [Rhodospirillaceae bacterium]|nr:DNA-packaging protein [Rhodospirillaceae bacterium]